MNYFEQLQTFEWLNFRKEILKRDRFECLNCKNSRLIENSSIGFIKGITRDRGLLYLLNRSDPRFHTRYNIKFENQFGEEFKEQIKSHFEYNQEQLDIFCSKKLYLSDENYTIANSKISCIPNYLKSDSWFFVNRLDVHHIKYLPNKMAWEYSPELLQTLCWICHESFHAS